MSSNAVPLSLDSLLAVPDLRAAGLRQAAGRLLAAQSVVLTTHLNADGDGAGSQIALGAWLTGRGVGVHIVNPTPFPESFRFLLPEAVRVLELNDADAAAVLQAADLFCVLDTSEPRRIGALAEWTMPKKTLVLDHHQPVDAAVGGLRVEDPTAAATGELIYDLVQLAGGDWNADSVLAAYVALVSDTGSFRFGNTTARVHAIVADLVRRGIDPEAVYRRLFATVPRRRLDLVREALVTLRTEPETGLSWLVVPDEMVRRLRATHEDLDGLIEYARSIEGTEVALMFRETADGETKVSFRSNGAADVNAIARRFGGGGHIKASGAVVPQPPAQAVPRVLEAARAALSPREDAQ